MFHLSIVHMQGNRRKSLCWETSAIALICLQFPSGFRLQTTSSTTWPSAGSTASFTGSSRIAGTQWRLPLGERLLFHAALIDRRPHSSPHIRGDNWLLIRMHNAQYSCVPLFHATQRAQVMCQYPPTHSCLDSAEKHFQRSPWQGLLHQHGSHLRRSKGTF